MNEFKWKSQIECELFLHVIGWSRVGMALASLSSAAHAGSLRNVFYEWMVTGESTALQHLPH